MSDDSSKRIKPSSVAAFLFMPQFGQMFRTSSHIVPVFMRTIANLFVQAGLIPPNHPAALYGAPGVEKCSFPKMLGDAWYTLRTTAASAYQWSIFGSVLLMIFVFFISITSLVYNFSSGIITTASAQSYIFTSPLGPTDIQNMPPANSGPCNQSTPLCRIIPPSGSPYGDYAIDLLDKMLRLGANQTGGPLQNATGALMSIYNSGILFIAACMLFWLIISIVVDIARTGQVGGGRHNLVWAPIRIVFALGMMVPLGNSGFSSGQFVIMKIAEWGSNFGSNGWNAYLTAVLKDGNVKAIPDLSLGPGLESLAGAYERLWICKVAHNGYGYQAEGEAFRTPNLDQYVQIRLDTSVIDNGVMTYHYTNATSNDLCGGVSFPTGNDPVLLATKDDPNADTVAKAEATYKYNMDMAWKNLFINGYTPGMAPTDPNNPSQNLDQNLPLAAQARAFACDFVSQHIWGKVDGKDVLYVDCGEKGDQYGACGSKGPGTGSYPNMSCIDNIQNEMDRKTLTGIIGKAIHDAAQTETTKIQGIPPDAIFGKRGWADMASFFKAITTLTTTVKYSLAIPVQIIAPGINASSDGQANKVQEVLAKYNDWLSSVPASEQAPAASAACQTDPPTAQCALARIHDGFEGSGNPFQSKDASGGGFSWDPTGISGLIKMVQNSVNILKTIASMPLQVSHFIGKVIDAYKGNSFMGIPRPTERVNEYPLEILSSIGVNLLTIWAALEGAMMLMEFAAAALPFIDASAGLGSSILGHLVSIFGDILASCGFVLVYYLPMMPYIRVAHAVLVWMVTVFEAVMLVPIACLSFLDTEKEGMYNKMPFVNWLDILTRPILTVIGYVGAVLVFDAFFGYLLDSFGNAVKAEMADQNVLVHLFGMVANAVLFTFLAYTTANTSFKMISLIPDAFFRWLPGGQASGASQWQAPEGASVMQQVGYQTTSATSKMGRGMAKTAGKLAGGGAKAGKDIANILMGGDKKNPGASDGKE